MSIPFIIFAFILVFTATVYVRQILKFTRGLSRLVPGGNKQSFTVAVLVPARNEEAHVESCIHSLLRQEYPKDLYRIIVIDDQSTDGTADIVRRLVRENPSRLTLLSVDQEPKEVSPKINALRFGVKESGSDLLFMTDADCEVSPEWISSTVRYFEGGVGVVTGTTLYKNNNTTSRQLFGIQFLDFLSHTACAAGAIGNGAVNNCNGSNMAIRRRAYDDVGGYDSLARLNSGDDSLLAQKISSSGTWQVRFNLDRSSFVTTGPVRTWKEFFRQRMRWAAQTANYRADALFFLVCSFFYYIVLTAVLIGSAFSPPWIMLFMIAFLPKLFVDYHILKKFTTFSGTQYLMHFYPQAALVHVPTVLVAVLGGFFGRFDWKGRATERRTDV